MKLEKKRILKEDGRYLVFYHSAESASEAQTETFAGIAAETETVQAGGKPDSRDAEKASAANV